jgi:CDP-diacylglycerol--glycerol-3-phosphate 3-phosphatidyltransferase
MSNRAFYLVNVISVYRMMASPLLVILALTGFYDVFKWMLPLSFATDMVDGYLARKYKVATKIGSFLDSIADDLTVIAGIVGLFVWKMDFMRENKVVIIGLMILLLIQNALALIKYRKLSSFHTYGAKISALFQGVFLILMFLLPEPIYPLFYVAVIISALDLIEEIIMVIIIPKWMTDVKGLYWVFKDKEKYML